MMRFRRIDDGMVSIWIIMVIIAVVAILVVAAITYVGIDDYGDRVTDDDIAVIYVQGTLRITDVGIFGLGLPGLIDALVGCTYLNMDSRVEYDIHDDDDRDLWSLEFSPMSSWFEKTIKLQCKARCTGPGDYDDTAKEYKEITFNILADTAKVNFEEFQFPVEKPGVYKIVMSVTADKTDICEKTVTVTVLGVE